MNKKLKIILIATFLMLIMAIFLPKITLAAGFNKDYIDQSLTTNQDLNTVKTITATAVAVIRIVAAGIAIIMLIYIAIKYMTEAPEGKANFKKSAQLYIVGAVLLFATAGILSIFEGDDSIIKLLFRED